MNAKGYLMLSGCVFLLVAVMHAWRAIAALPVVVGGTSLPVWGSWVAVVVAGGLSAWGFRLAIRS